MKFSLALFSALFLACITSAQDADRPHVVVLLVDDLGVMDTNLTDDAFYETPNIQRLAERGMNFVNGYCAHPRCVPSRYAIQTGRFPFRDSMNSVSAEKALKKHQTIGEAFFENGYATFFTGKWHLGKSEESWPHHRGYEVNIGGCHAGSPGSYFFPYHIARKTGKEGKYGPLYNLAEGEKDEHLTDRITRETEDWIRGQVTTEDGKPFFAFLSHYAVHTPIEGKPEEVAHYAEKTKALESVQQAYINAGSASKARRDDPHYASMIQTMDESIGAVLDLLDELKIADKTIIALTSDHGGLSNRGLTSNRDVATSNLPYRAGKGHLYEGGLRVPFVIAYPPMVEAGNESATVALGTDLFPTLLDLAGLPLMTDSHADGISLVPSLTGTENPQKRKRPQIWHSPLPRPTQTGDAAASAIRVKDRKLVKNYFPVSFELFDLASDPYEQINLAADQPDEVAELQRRLEENLVRQEAMPPRKDWKDKTVAAPLKAE